jgi:hypothetical protein
MWFERMLLAGGAILACVVQIAAAAPASNGEAAAPIFGYYDARTGLFTAAPQEPQFQAAAPASSPITRKGTIQVEASFKIDPSIPKNATINAFVTIEVDADASETGSQPPVKRAGETGTVNVSLPYYFEVDSASDKIAVQLVLSEFQRVPYVTLIQYIDLPADGATTIVKFPATL